MKHLPDQGQYQMNPDCSFYFGKITKKNRLYKICHLVKTQYSNQARRGESATGQSWVLELFWLFLRAHKTHQSATNRQVQVSQTGGFLLLIASNLHVLLGKRQPVMALGHKSSCLPWPITGETNQFKKGCIQWIIPSLVGNLSHTKFQVDSF